MSELTQAQKDRASLERGISVTRATIGAYKRKHVPVPKYLERRLRTLEEALRTELPEPGDKRLPGFRKGAHPNSRAAALSHYPRSGSARMRVLETFAAHEAGLTHEELTSILSPENPGLSTYRSRASELCEDGWIEDAGIKRRTLAGDLSEVWRITETAKSEMLRRGWVPAGVPG